MNKTDFVDLLRLINSYGIDGIKSVINNIHKINDTDIGTLTIRRFVEFVGSTEEAVKQIDDINNSYKEFIASKNNKNIFVNRNESIVKYVNAEPKIKIPEYKIVSPTKTYITLRMSNNSFIRLKDLVGKIIFIDNTKNNNKKYISIKVSQSNLKNLSEELKSRKIKIELLKGGHTLTCSPDHRTILTKQSAGNYFNEQNNLSNISNLSTYIEGVVHQQKTKDNFNDISDIHDISNLSTYIEGVVHQHKTKDNFNDISDIDDISNLSTYIEGIVSQHKTKDNFNDISDIDDISNLSTYIEGIVSQHKKKIINEQNNSSSSFSNSSNASNSSNTKNSSNTNKKIIKFVESESDLPMEDTASSLVFS